MTKIWLVEHTGGGMRKCPFRDTSELMGGNGFCFLHWLDGKPGKICEPVRDADGHYTIGVPADCPLRDGPIVVKLK